MSITSPILANAVRVAELPADSVASLLKSVGAGVPVQAATAGEPVAFRPVQPVADGIVLAKGSPSESHDAFAIRYRVL